MIFWTKHEALQAIHARHFLPGWQRDQRTTIPDLPTQAFAYPIKPDTNDLLNIRQNGPKNC
jgi:hypothetical protein